MKIVFLQTCMDDMIGDLKELSNEEIGTKLRKY